MLNWLRRRRLSADARRRLMILAARSEEALIETHVENAVALLDSLADEVDLDRGIELYEEMMGIHPPYANTIKTRILARLETTRPGPARPGGAGVTRPKRKPR